MKTVAILAQKGGVGKTTLAVHLAVASSRRRNTAIIDLDPQASAARWADRRSAVASTLSLVWTIGAPVPVFVVLNGVQPRGRDAEEASEAIGGLGVEVAPARVVNRVLFARALITGHSAEELRAEGKAAREIAQVHAFMCAQLNLGG